jgi:hypothetical protein
VSTTTFRTDLRAGCYAILGIVQTAHPTLLPDISPSAPESYTTPMGYVEKGVRESGDVQAQTWTRQLDAAIVLVNKLMSNDQAANEQDALVDLVVEAIIDNPHIVSGATLVQPAGIQDFELSGGEGVKYSAVRIVVRGSIWLGRA